MTDCSAKRLSAVFVVLSLFLLSACSTAEKRPLNPEVMKQRAISGVSDWPDAAQVREKVEETKIYAEEETGGEAEDQQVLDDASEPLSSADESSNDITEGEVPVPTEGWWQLRFKINWVGSDNNQEEKKEQEDEACSCADTASIKEGEDEPDAAESAVNDVGDNSNSESVVAENDLPSKDDNSDSESKQISEDSDKISKTDEVKGKEEKEVKKDTNRDDIEDPSWFIGSLIADRILAPVIREQGDNFFLWRFHRRAGTGPTGHQFSLIFYSTTQTAEEVFTSIKVNKLVEQLIEEELLVEVKYPETMEIDKPGIADTSDHRWSEEVQNAWPIFIMGASEMWLMLTETIADANPKSKENMSVDELVELYEEVEEEINGLWREEARHAYFHHLNAIFGYEYLLMRF